MGTAISAGLNGLAGQVKVLQGDLFEPVTGYEFDVILANPPFVAAPDPTVHAQLVNLSLYAAGGPDGLNVTRRILEGAHTMLADNGFVLVVGDMPNIQSSAPSWASCFLENLSLHVVYAPEHSQTSEEYAAFRGPPVSSARSAWADAMRNAGAECMTDALLVAWHSSPGSWTTTPWHAQGFESWLEDGRTAHSVRTAVAKASLLKCAVEPCEFLHTAEDEPWLPPTWTAGAYAR